MNDASSSSSLDMFDLPTRDIAIKNEAVNKQKNTRDDVVANLSLSLLAMDRDREKHRSQLCQPLVLI